MNLLKFNELAVEIDAPKDLFYRASRYVSYNETSSNIFGKISVIQAGNAKINMTNFPYDSIKLDGNTINYFRYDTLVRSIISTGENDYLVLSYIKNDEEAILKPFREIYFKQFGAKKSIIHGSLLDYEGRGILLAGPKRIGKSTLTLALSETKEINVVAEGQVLTDKELIASYIPKAIYLRLYPFVNSYFRKYINDLNALESTQPIDSVSWNRIKNANYWLADENITLSRKKYLEIIGSSDLARTNINSIIIPQYSLGKTFIRPVASKELLEVIKQEILPKHSLIENKTANFVDFKRIASKLNKIPAITVGFSKKEDLTDKFLEKIINQEFF